MDARDAAPARVPSTHANNRAAGATAEDLQDRLRRQRQHALTTQTGAAESTGSDGGDIFVLPAQDAPVVEVEMASIA